MGASIRGGRGKEHLRILHCHSIMSDMEHSQPRRLYRSDTNRIFAGICGGIGEYANIDPVLIRLVWTLVVIFTGLVPGVLAYIIAVFIVPERPVVPHVHEQ